MIQNHESATHQSRSVHPSPYEIPITEVIERIESLNDGLRIFWQDSEGWASVKTAKLLKKSRLDWQVSLSRCLNLWITEASGEKENGKLILAWANLGSLVEGSMKLFLSVWYTTYLEDRDELFLRNDKIRDPDVLSIEPMRQYFKRKIWDKYWDHWVLNIQQKRNAIHAYKNRDIASFEDFNNDVRRYLEFVRYINFRLPYPDQMYIPRESLSIESEYENDLPF